MPISIRGRVDDPVQQVFDAFSRYATEHPQAEIAIYRQNSVSIRVRIVDPKFDGLSRGERHDLAWRFIEDLPDDVQSQVSLLLALAPREVPKSFANLEFDNPTPSRL